MTPPLLCNSSIYSTIRLQCQEQLGSECNVMKRAPRDTIHAFTFNQDLQALFQIL